MILIDAADIGCMLHRGQNGPRRSGAAPLAARRVDDEVVSSKGSPWGVGLDEPERQRIVLHERRQVPDARADLDGGYAAPVAEWIESEIQDTPLREGIRLIRRSNGIAAVGERAGWKAQ